MTGVSILGCASYIGSRVVGNEFLEDKLGFRRGTIEKRTGIKERRWAEEHETVQYMAEQTVAKMASAMPVDIDAVIIAHDVVLTKRAEVLLPGIKQVLRHYDRRADRCYSINIYNYCPGFVHGINMAQGLVRSEQARNVLVVAAANYNDIIELDEAFNNNMQHILNPESQLIERLTKAKGDVQFQAPRLNAFLWGSGAGAVVVGKSDEDRILHFEAQGSKHQAEAFIFGESYTGQNFCALDGPAIYKYGVEEVPEFIRGLVERAGLTLKDIDHFIPHQPHPRMLASILERLPELKDKTHISCDTLGNTAVAAIPITYDLAGKSHKIKRWQKVLMCGFGDQYLTVNGLIFEER
jgi:3-oxoacyl-[acyl-carrier-protein] synthase-3